MGKTSSEKRKRSEKGKEKAERTEDEDESSDEEPLVKKAKVAEVVAEDTPPPVPEFVKGEVEHHNEVEDRVEGEAEQPRVAEGLGQGAREARPDGVLMREASVTMTGHRKNVTKGLKT